MSRVPLSARKLTLEVTSDWCLVGTLCDVVPPSLSAFYQLRQQFTPIFTDDVGSAI